MMSKISPIVIFRYHDHYDVVEQRVAWLRGLNSGVDIHGMYGGESCPGGVARLFDSNHSLRLHRFMCWFNLDLAVMEWYRSVGRELSFSHAYIVEWDLVYLRGLSEVLPVPAAGQSLLTGYTDLADVEHEWVWTSGEIPRVHSHWRALRKYVRENYGATGPYRACRGPGTVFSPQFFEAYDTLRLPALCNDEIRLPLIHDIVGLSVADNGLYPRAWFSAEITEWNARFNTDRLEITPGALYSAGRAGHLVFHPVYQVLSAASCGLGK